jgi:large subunit ribosomal protein L17
MRNLATSLVLAERIETTLPKALELRRVADRLITWAKEGSLHARRQAARVLQDEGALRKLFNGLGQRFTDRQGGYTRIYKFGYRRGDSAEMAAIEYLGYQLPAPQTKEKGEGQKSEAKKETKKAAKAKSSKAETKEAKAAKAEKKTEKKIEKKKDKKEAGTGAAGEGKGKWGLFGRGKKEGK